MRGLVLTTVLLLWGGTGLQAGTIYVDSRIGNDRHDGTSSQVLNEYVGPVATLARAARLVKRGDSLVLADNGVPYYGSVTLFGHCFSGTHHQPFRLLGNGAVITGAKPVDPASWTELDGNLWRLTPRRKGHFQLLQNGQAVPRVELPWPAENLPNLPVGSWGVYHGRIYYKGAPDDDPRWHDFALAEAGTGLTLLGVENVEISDVTFQHFRLDGVNAHDRCRNVVLRNVHSLENGRAGFAVGGSSHLQIHGGQVRGNYVHSLLVTELGEANVEGTDFDRPPSVEE